MVALRGKKVGAKIVANSCVMVIFGAGGDLTKRLLLPAICNLGGAGLLADDFAIIGITRGFDDISFRDYMKKSVREFVQGDAAIQYGEKLVERIFCVSGDFSDDKLYSDIKDKLEKIQSENHASRNHLFYLATPPTFFSTIVEKLGSSKLVQEEGGLWRRVVIEKPFGHDLQSAKQLDKKIGTVLSEEQIFRIDHYLGKETVQNILAFRFSNGIFEPIWNRRYIDHVQITVAESLGVELRGGYFDHAGSLRDMVPNHVFQLLSLIAMEPPISFDADSVRDEKAKVLRAVQPILPEEVLLHTVRGQYGAGVIDGKSVAPYRSEVGIDPKSSTETYVAMRLLLDSWRWAGVPFYVRTGKRMPNRVTEIAIQFKTAPLVMFRETDVQDLTANLLVIHIQPEEGISLRFGAKIPGPLMKIGEVNMRFQYEDYFGSRPGTGYETLLYDCMKGDGTLFQRSDMVESGWSVVEPVLDVWSALTPRNFPNYTAGTWGPKDADELLARDGRKWRNY